MAFTLKQGQLQPLGKYAATSRAEKLLLAKPGLHIWIGEGPAEEWESRRGDKKFLTMAR